MGKATVVTDHGAGSYTVDVKLDTTAIAAKIADLAQRESELTTTVLPAAEAELATRKAEFDTKEAALNTAIDAYNQAKDAPETCIECFSLEQCEPCTIPVGTWRFGPLGTCIYADEAACQAANPPPPNWKYGASGSCDYYSEGECVEKNSPAARLAAMNAAAAAMTTAGVHYGTQYKRVATLKLELVSNAKEATRLGAVPSSIQTSAWCADYTEGLSGDVGTIEVPSGERAMHLQLRPGYSGAAVYTGSRDGQLRRPFADLSAATLYNLAMLPGIQKWLPRYRLGEITSIDRGAQTCSVDLWDATSSQQDIDVNDSASLTGVTFDYMSCGDAAFTAGDSVVVEFPNTDLVDPESNWDTARVIGFVEDPKECASAGFVCWPGADAAVYGWGDPYLPGNAPLGTIQLSFSDSAHIARHVEGSSVTHGVATISAPRDWRGGSTIAKRDANTYDLLIAWDADAIYSGGVGIQAGAGILAAALQWVWPFSEPTPVYYPYLLWAQSDGWIYQRPCTISADGKSIESVSGATTSARIYALAASIVWCEFNQDGTRLAISYGAYSNRIVSESSFIPDWDFTGETIGSSVKYTQYEAADTSYTSGFVFSGSRNFILKAQYVDDVLTPIWAKIEVQRDEGNTTGPMVYLAAEYWNTYYCMSGCGGDTTAGTHVGYVLAENYELQEIKLSIVAGTEEVVEKNLYLNNEERSQKNWSAANVQRTVSGGCDGALPLPSYVPVGSNTDAEGDYCIVHGATDAVANITQEENWITVDQLGIDIRNGVNRAVIRDTGYTHGFGADVSHRLRGELWRDGSEQLSGEISGDYGEIVWPRLENAVPPQPIQSEADIEDVLSDIWIELQVGDTGAVRAIDITSAGGVFCLWGADQDDGNALKYVSAADGIDVLDVLEIDAETGARIVLEGEDRFFGLLELS